MVLTEKLLDKIKKAIIELDTEQTKNLVEEALEEDVQPLDIINSMSEGMEEIGEKYSAGEAFLTDMLMASETMKIGMQIVKPHLKDEQKAAAHKVVLGTVEGDIHDIGKDLVKTLLTSSGFEVYDLGVDVPASKFVEKVKEVSADIVAMSALLSTAADRMSSVVEALQAEKIRDKVKVIIGGAATTPSLALKIDADAHGKDALEGAQICKQFFSK